MLLHVPGDAIVRLKEVLGTNSGEAANKVQVHRNRSVQIRKPATFIDKDSSSWLDYTPTNSDQKKKIVF